MPHDARSALKNLEKVLSRDPLLRDVLEQAVPGARRAGPFTPDVDVLVTEDGWEVFIDVPGVRREYLDVELEGTRMVVQGTRSAGHPSGAKVVSVERPTGDFRRSFAIPAGADGDAVRARLRDGVLQVTLPRLPGESRVFGRERRSPQPCLALEGGSSVCLY